MRSTYSASVKHYYYYYHYHYHYYYYYYYYYMQLSCRSVAVVLTLVETKQINIHKRNNTKNTVQTIQNTRE